MSDRTQCISTTPPANGPGASAPPPPPPPEDDAAGASAGPASRPAIPGRSAGGPPGPPGPSPMGSAEPNLPARPEPDEPGAFREPFLLHMAPQAAEAARVLGRTLYPLLLEMDLPPASPRGTEDRGRRGEVPGWIAVRLEAMVAELRFGERYLEALGRERFSSGLTERDARLAEEAEEWADDLRLIAEEMELALGLPRGGAGEEGGARE